jgi:hypothetical protein
MDWESTALMESFKAMAINVIKQWNSEKEDNAGPKCRTCGSTALKVRDCKKKEDWMKKVSKGGSQQRTGGKGKKVENRITEVEEASEAEN